MESKIMTKEKPVFLITMVGRAPIFVTAGSEPRQMRETTRTQNESTRIYLQHKVYNS